MGTVTHVPSMGTPGNYRPADEPLSAERVLQRALSSTKNVCSSLSSISKAGATKKRAATTGQKIINILKNVTHIGKSSPVPTRFNLSAVTRSTPGDLVSLEATTNINKLRADFRLFQSQFEHFDSTVEKLHAFGKMCEIYETAQSSLNSQFKHFDSESKVQDAFGKMCGMCDNVRSSLTSQFEHFDGESKVLDAFGKMCEIYDTVQSFLKDQLEHFDIESTVQDACGKMYEIYDTVRSSSKSQSEHFDSKSKVLFAFGKMCEIEDTVQSSLKEVQKLKESLSAVHISAIGLDTLIKEYESLGKGLDSGRLTNFHNNRNISPEHIQRIWKDIEPTINKTEKLAEKPSPRKAKNMGFDSVMDAKLLLCDKLYSAFENVKQQLDTVDKNPGIHHKSIRPQLKKMFDLIIKALEDLFFDERQQNRQAHLAQQETESWVKKYLPFKSASAGQKSAMLGEKVSLHQFTEIKRQETLEKTDLGPMSDIDSYSPPAVS